MLDQKTLKDLQAYVQNYINEMPIVSSQESFRMENILEDAKQNDLEDFINNNREPTLQQLLFNHIDTKGLSDPEVYTKAGIDRRHFSKIRTNSTYRPKKNTIIALSFALKLNRKDTDVLLSSAGYSLSNSDTYDLVVQFCLEKKIYDFYDVNQALDYFSLEPLGGTL